MKGRLSFLTIVVIALLAVNGFFIFESLKTSESEGSSFAQEAMSSVQAYVLPVSEVSYIPFLNSNVPQPELSAKSVLVYDMRSGRFLFQKNSRDRVPIASLTKIMTAIVAVEILKPEDIVTIPPEAIRVDGEKQDLYVDEQITVENLLKLMLIQSSNDAAYALALYAKSKSIDLIAEMNKKAAALEMENSRFVDPAGLNDQGYSTAQDFSKLVRYAVRYQSVWNALVLQELTVASVDGKITHAAKNTNQLLGVIPNIVGGKTGFTDGALGCLLLLVKIPDHNDTIMSIVLGSQDRFGDSQKVVEWVQKAYRWE